MVGLPMCFEAVGRELVGGCHDLDQRRYLAGLIVQGIAWLR